MALSSPSTSLSLIRRVGEQDPPAWERLVKIYGPLVYRWCRRRGIEANDAADIMQEVFSAVSRSIDRFQRAGGNQPFRGWLYGITSYKIKDHFRANQRQPLIVDANALEETMAGEPAEADYFGDPSNAQIDLQVVVRLALEAIRDEYTEIIWRAFWRTAIDNQPATEVAEELGLQAAHVRQIKFRVLKRVRLELQGLEPDTESLSHTTLSRTSE